MAQNRERFAERVAEEINEPEIIYVKTVINLFDEDNTIPFIARYRKAQTGGMDADKLRRLKKAHDALKAANQKAEKIVQKLGSTLSHGAKEQFFEAKTVDEVNELFAPYKKGGKGSLAERARQLGLEAPAMNILERVHQRVELNSFIKRNQEGLRDFSEVRDGMQHIIADVISKDKTTNDTISSLIAGKVMLHSATTEAKVKADKQRKFELYYDFTRNTNALQSHQILAINRGEEQKILTVKISFSEHTKKEILQWLQMHWVPRNASDQSRLILIAAVEDSFKRLLEKKFLRRVRAKITSNAEREAVEIFSKNLKKMLLASPVKGKNVLAIDPGFNHGCKVAALNQQGQALDTRVIYPFKNEKVAEGALEDLVKRHGCAVIGIGNGTACRETETWVANMIKKGVFEPLDVSYCIVNESGASIYSVTKLADQELPGMDPNLRSAVSIGRRLQDPLLELVKIEPKHIGVGMYQHDVSEVLMRNALEGVLEDCVSFVGVDLNASSVTVLRRIAGLGQKKAEAIIAWREKNGPFVSRNQLLHVKGLGKRAFQQCAGFIRVVAQPNQEPSRDEDEIEITRVIPASGTTVRKRLAESKSASEAKKRKIDCEYAFEPLDQTLIHPESYHITYRLLEEVGGTALQIGSPTLVNLLDGARQHRLKELKESLEIDEETLLLIMKGLQQPLGYDLRSEMEQPSFKKGLKSIYDLRAGQKVTGVVGNVVSFGVFVDCGVGRDGLIHSSNLNGYKDLGPGDKCECLVLDVDSERGRINLRLVKRELTGPVLT